MRGSTANSAQARMTLWVGLLLSAGLLAAGCGAKHIRRLDDGRILNRKLDYSIDAPQFPDADIWRPIGLDGADLAWYTDDGQSMSLASSCKKTQAEPFMLARRLLVGVPRDAVLAAYPVALRGDAGWAQTVVTGAGRSAVRVRTVTVVNGGCVFDWVLVTPAHQDDEAASAIFEAWWSSFRRPSSVAEDDRDSAAGEAPGEEGSS